MEFECDDNAFADKDSVARYFENYATMIEAPIETGVTVEAVKPHVGEGMFDCFALGVQNAVFKGDVDAGFHEAHFLKSWSP